MATHTSVPDGLMTDSDQGPPSSVCAYNVVVLTSAQTLLATISRPDADLAVHDGSW